MVGESTLENEGVTKGEHYIGIPTVGDIGILREQLYSMAARLEIALGSLSFLRRRASARDEYKRRTELSCIGVHA